MIPYFSVFKWETLVRLKFQKRSELKLVSRNETQTSEMKCTEVCWSNYPIAISYWKLSSKRSAVGLVIPYLQAKQSRPDYLMRLQLRERSGTELAGRIIPEAGFVTQSP
jgi:hypothetical protein